jgi:HEAT repeat protein
MSDLARWLSTEDLRSDGAANQVVEVVRRNPDLLSDLIDALDSSHPATRGHADDALEKLGRERVLDLRRYLPIFLNALRRDEVSMVRWHMAMLLGHLSPEPRIVPRLVPALARATRDPSVFVQSWAVTSLCLIARQVPSRAGSIARMIAPLTRSSSIALRGRARRALSLIANPTAAFPRGWIKAQALRHLESGGGAAPSSGRRRARTHRR